MWQVWILSHTKVISQQAYGEDASIPEISCYLTVIKKGILFINCPKPLAIAIVELYKSIWNNIAKICISEKNAIKRWTDPTGHWRLYFLELIELASESSLDMPYTKMRDIFLREAAKK